jgi:gliding motility-associated-like protein
MAFYRDCGNSVDPNPVFPGVQDRTVSFANGCGLPNPDTLLLTQVNPPVSVAVTCPTATNACSTPQNLANPGVEEYIFEGIETLPATPCASWRVFVQRTGGRNSIIDNVTGPVGFDGSIGYYVDAKINTNFCNNSPQFTVPPVFFTCVGQNFYFNNGAFDVDGDSLVTNIICPRTDNWITNCVYLPGLSCTQPLFTAPPNGTSINSATGDISIINPNAPQVTVLAVEVLEYRNGVLVGSTMRDIQLSVYNCGANNNPQQITIPSATGGTITAAGDVIICPGQTVTIQVNAADPNPADQVTLTCPNLALFPGATFTSTPGNPAVGTFTWTPPVGIVGLKSVSFFARDNACPTYATTSRVYNIIVAGPTVAPADMVVCPGAVVSLPALVTPFIPPGTTFSWTNLSGSAPVNTFSCLNCSAPNVTMNSTETFVVTTNLPAGCKNKDTVTVTVVPNFTAAVNASTLSICTGETSILNLLPSVPTAGGTYSYSWSPATYLSGTTGPSVTFAPPPAAATTVPVNYTITGTITSPLSCFVRNASVTITVKPRPNTPTISCSDPDRVVCQSEGPITFTAAVAPVPAGTTFLWTLPDGSTSSANPLVIPSANFAQHNGNFSVVAITNGCTSAVATQSFQVIERQADQSVLAGDCEGSLLPLAGPSVSVSPVQPYSWSWSGPMGFTATTQNVTLGPLTSMMSGAYTVAAMAAGCTVLVKTYNVSVGIASVPAASPPFQDLCEGGTITLTGVSSITTPAPEFWWTGPAGYNNTTISSTIFINNATPAMSGTYTLRTIVNGCTSLVASSINVNVKPKPVVNANYVLPLCEGGTLQLNANSSLPGATYQWIGPGGFSSTAQNPTIPAVTVAQSGAYVVQATVNGCSSDPVTVNVVVTPIPVATAATTTSTPCTGQSILLYATSNPASGASFVWSGPGGFTSTDQNPVITNATPGMSGNYSVIAVVNGCSSAASVPVTISVLPLPSDPVVSLAPNPVCMGQPVVLTVTNHVAGQTYEWTQPNSSVVTTPGPTLTIAATDTAIHRGVWTVRAVGLNGCLSASTGSSAQPNLIVVGLQTPVLPAITQCAGFPLNLNAPNVSQPGFPATYSWTGPGGFTATTQNPTIPNPNTSNSGVYSVFATVNGCPALSANINVTIKAIPSGFSASNNGFLCSGQTLTLSVTPLAGATYLWTGPAGFSETTTATTVTVPNVSVAQAGIYSVNAVVNACTSGTPATTTVDIRPTPVVTNLRSNSPVCQNTPLNLQIDPIAGGSYFWSGPNGFVSNVQNPVIPSISPTEAGNYSVYVVANGCTSATATMNVTVKPEPAVPAFIEHNGPLCEGSTLILSTPTVPGANYLWSGPNGFVSTEQNPTRSLVTAIDSGVYEVRVIVDGCTSKARQAVVPIFYTPFPPEPLSYIAPVCEGEKLRLFAANTAAGGRYFWSGPAGFVSTDQNPIIDNVTQANSGTYYVVAIINGCSSATRSIDVTITPLPVISRNPDNNSPVCVGDTIRLNAEEVPGALAYLWRGPNGFTASGRAIEIYNATPIMTGDYYVQAVVGACTSAARATPVAVYEIPPAPDTLFSNTPICEGQTLRLFAQAVPGVEFLWRGPNGFRSSEQNPEIRNASLINSGDYQCITIIGRCTSSAKTTSVQIKPTAPAPVIVSNGKRFCTGETIELSIEPFPAAIYEWRGPNGFSSNDTKISIPNVTPENGGAYVAVASLNGCKGLEARIEITVRPLPVPDFEFVNNCDTIATFINKTEWGLQRVEIEPDTFNPSIRVPFRSRKTGDYDSTFYLTEVNYRYPAPGNYVARLWVTDTFGCRNSVSKAITIKPSAVAAIAGDTNVCGGKVAILRSVGSLPAGVPVSFAWYRYNTLIGTDSVLVLRATKTDTFPIRLVVKTAGGCIDSAQTRVVTRGQVIGYVTAAGACTNDPVRLGFVAQKDTFSPIRYQWQGDGGLTGNTAVINFVYATAGTYNFTVTVTNGNGCDSVYSGSVIVSPRPEAPIVAPATICQKKATLLTAQYPADSTASFGWYSSDTATQPIGGGNTYFTGPLEVTTTYFVSTIIAGCEGPRIPVTVTVTPRSTASFVSQPYAGQDRPVPLPLAKLKFENINQPGQQNRWDFGDGTTSSELTPTHTYLRPGVYRVTLRTDLNGCRDSSFLVVFVDGVKNFIMPNAFSPNGDGNNDELKIPNYGLHNQGKGAEAFSLRVYDRWGGLLFESEDVNKSWDGNAPDGTPVPQGVYVYVVKFRYAAEQSQTTLEPMQEQKGTISIFR